MFNRLPEPDTTPLGNSPLGLVLCTLAIDEERPLKSRDATQWQRRLAEAYSAGSLNRVIQQTVNLRMGPLGAQATGQPEMQEGWRLVRRDGAGYAEMFAGSCTVAATRFPGFVVFREQLRAVWAVYADILDPQVRSRLSIQYFNALSEEGATSATYWETRVHERFLGLAADERFADMLTNEMGIVDFQGERFSCRLRHAIQADAAIAGNIAYVFDIEVKDEAPVDLDMAASLEEVEQMNRGALQMFQAVLTENYLRERRADV